MNSVNILGRVTKDIEVKQTSSQKCFITFTVAVEKVINGEKSAYFIDCVAWEKRAQTIAQYFHKGSKIAINGELTTRTWEDDNGGKHKVTEVLVAGFDFCESNTTSQNKPVEKPTTPPAPPAPEEEVDIMDLPFEF